MTNCKTIETLKLGCNRIEKALINNNHFEYYFNGSEITEKDYTHWRNFFNQK